MIKVSAELANAIAREVRLNIETFDFSLARSKNRALHDLLCNLTNNYEHNANLWFDIQSVYYHHLIADMDHLYDIEREVINYINKAFNNED